MANDDPEHLMRGSRYIQMPSTKVGGISHFKPLHSESHRCKLRLVAQIATGASPYGYLEVSSYTSRRGSCGKTRYLLIICKDNHTHKAGGVT